MTSTISQETLQSLAQAIAAVLGADWTLTSLPEGCRWVEVRHSDGYGFHLSNSWPQGRLTISGVWPHSTTGHTFAPWSHRAKISVSATKTGAQIAHDMTRRFLPRYLPQWREQATRRDQSETYNRQTHALGRRLAAQVDVAYHEDHRCLYFLNNTVNVYGEHVSMQLREVSATQAERILAILVEPPVSIPLLDTATAHLTAVDIVA